MSSTKSYQSCVFAQKYNLYIQLIETAPAILTHVNLLSFSFTISWPEPSSKEGKVNPENEKHFLCSLFYGSATSHIHASLLLKC